MVHIHMVHKDRTVPIIMAGCIAHARADIFPLPLLNMTSSSCSSTPISFKTLKFRRFGHKWVLYCVFYCACTKWPFFHFRSKSWRHHRVLRPRLTSRRGNFGASRTFKDYLIFSSVFRTSWPKMGVWGKIGEGVVRYWPLTNSFFLLEVLTSVPILVKIDQEMRLWECSQTNRQTHRHTDANRFYNLPHAICYSYGTDKNEVVLQNS